MTRDQFDELRREITASGSERERMMFGQMQVMVYGAEAHRRVLENERRCRMTTETALRDTQLKLTKMQMLLRVSHKSLKKVDLVRVIESALAEVDGVEDEGDSSPRL